MKSHDEQLKLQAFLDGELSEAEARQIANAVAQDQEAALLLAELRNTRQALAGSVGPVLLPEPREFYWSKIERDIRSQDKRDSAPQTATGLSLWLRFLIPSGAAAVCLLTAFFAAIQLGVFASAAGPELQTASNDSGAFTYRDYEHGATLIWLSYPAENEVAQTSDSGTVK